MASSSDSFLDELEVTEVNLSQTTGESELYVLLRNYIHILTFGLGQEMLVKTNKPQRLPSQSTQSSSHLLFLKRRVLMKRVHCINAYLDALALNH